MEKHKCVFTNQQRIKYLELQKFISQQYNKFIAAEVLKYFCPGYSDEEIYKKVKSVFNILNINPCGTELREYSYDPKEIYDLIKE